MDLHTTRTLNLIGTVLFCIFSILISIYLIFVFGFLLFLGTSGEPFAICITVVLIWVVLVIFITFMLYKKTVLALDMGEYDTVKRWMLIGVILGIFFGGTITFVIFLISFISFDDAVRKTMYPQPYPYYPAPYYYPPPYSYYPPPPPQPPPQPAYQYQYPPPQHPYPQQPTPPQYEQQQQFQRRRERPATRKKTRSKGSQKS